MRGSKPSLGVQCLALGLALLCWAAPTRAAEDLVFAVARVPLSLPVYVAEAKGYFADEKLALKIVDCEIGLQCFGRMLDGRAHLATAAELPIVLASLRGAPFSIIATIANARGFEKIVLRRNRGIGDVADLRGKRVGTFIGTSAHYYLELVLLSAGVDPSQVSIVPIQTAGMSAALQANGIDAVAVPELWAFEAAKTLGPGAQVLVNRRLHVDTWNVAVSGALAGRREAELESLCRALDRAARFIAREPAQARAILRERVGLDEVVIDWVWSDIQFAVELRQSLVTGLEGQTRWALRSGLAVGSVPNYLEYIRPGPLSRVRPGAVNIVQ